MIWRDNNTFKMFDKQRIDADDIKYIAEDVAPKVQMYNEGCAVT